LKIYSLIVITFHLFYYSLLIAEESNFHFPPNPNGPTIILPTYELMRVGAIDSSKGLRLSNKLPPGSSDPTTGTPLDLKTNLFEVKSRDNRIAINEKKNMLALNCSGDILINDISKFELIRIYPELTPDNDKVTDIIIPIIYTGRINSNFEDSIIIDFDDITLKNKFSFVNKNQVFKPDISITNQIFSDHFIQKGLHPEMGRIIISNVTYNEDNLIASNVFIHSIEIDSTAPDYKQFSNFRVEETGQSIHEIKNYILEPSKELTITFDFNTNDTRLGEHFARLKVLSDAGEMTDDGLIPVTENNYNIDFDGNFTTSSISGNDDGGYIQANLVFDPQSSVEISDIVDQFEAKLISENPTNNDELRIRVSSRIEANAKFYITDINGKIVKELGEKSIIGEKEFSFNISDLVSGVYFITISANGMNQIIEFIVTR